MRRPRWRLWSPRTAARAPHFARIVYRYIIARPLSPPSLILFHAAVGSWAGLILCRECTLAFTRINRYMCVHIGSTTRVESANGAVLKCRLWVRYKLWVFLHADTFRSGAVFGFFNDEISSRSGRGSFL